MEDNCTFNWQPVDALPLFSATIKVMLEETEHQYRYIQFLKNGIYQIEKELIARIVAFYQTQLDRVMYYEEQLQRWLENTSQNLLNEKILIEITDLKNIVTIIKTFSNSIIDLAKKSDVVEACNDDILTVNKKMFLDFVNGKFEEKKKC